MNEMHCSALAGVFKTIGLAIVPILLTGILAAAGRGEEPAQGAAVVSNIQIVSDKVQDVSSIEAWKAAVIKPGMTDEEKALAIWTTVVKFRHQNPPPVEYLQPQDDGYCVHDPIKTFNVYGYGMCCCAASNVEALARAVGFKARGKAVSAHSLPELYYGGNWHMFDASLITYFRNERGEVANIDEIEANVTKWYESHPDMKGDTKKARAFMRDGGWRKGPSILTTSPTMDENGWYPAGTHGWYSPMGEYDGSVNYIYEYPYSQGYRVNVQLREGEVITRNWSNSGRYLDDKVKREYPVCVDTKIGEGDLRYAPKWGDLAVGRVGNGTIVYAVPLASGAARRSALEWSNLATTADDKKAPAMHVSGPGTGAFTVRMPSSYVYLGGAVSSTFVIGDGGSARVSISLNNGLDWQEIYSKAEKGTWKENIDLTALVYRLYDYRLRFELSGTGTGIDALTIANDIQHSQAPLPALNGYDNKVKFSAAPAEGTISIEALPAAKARGNQRTVFEFQPAFDGVECKTQGLALIRDGGTVTFPVETPGDMTRVRFGCFFNADSDASGWNLLVSFDNGKTWRSAGSVKRADAPCTWVTFSDVPAGTRKALVRYAGVGGSVNVIGNFRIDADYAEPAGGFRPVKVTYVWQENGQEKRDVHIARSPEETWEIHCSDKPVLRPVMKSLIVELAE